MVLSLQFEVRQFFLLELLLKLNASVHSRLWPRQSAGVRRTSRKRVEFAPVNFADKCIRNVSNNLIGKWSMAPAFDKRGDTRKIDFAKPLSKMREGVPTATTSFANSKRMTIRSSAFGTSGGRLEL